ncbi:hypothetical protein [Nonomuraea basaltis]|uniref:hypothetical protein n=1 Tax=Nonomuraea basaltis TaxID=2495887 RepID=UPI00110C6B0F|nr:hypothetical protein [Nonomuraea basaltis]TMR95572.1 hypothetical protein EJK15_27840 [Nonomuraea basaltis]
MNLNPEELPELWRPPIVEHAAATRSGAARYLLAWGDDAEGVRWGFLLWPPRTRQARDSVEHDGRARWVRWEDIRPVTGEDYSTVPVADRLM